MTGEERTIVLTDVVDSTQLNTHWGDEAMAQAWAAHDREARELMRVCHGREVGRSDGFLVLFERTADAIAFALGYHARLSTFELPLRARVGVHMGPVLLRVNSAADTAQGATPFEVDGVALPVAARVMAAALAGQTLLSAAAHQALGFTVHRTLSHGHWRFKGLAEPVEVYEIGAEHAPFIPPPDSAKAYRVVRSDEHWVPLNELPNNLPAEPDLFIGRHEALLALAQLFDDGARLVSVLGIGGLGKTRLALRYARAWLGDYPGGAWFCDLASARSVDGIVHAVAQGLDVPLGKAEPVRQLATAIAGRGACLIVLDNFEQVARHAEETVGAWLERAPQARFIVTSREVLGIAGEQALLLTPLDTAEAVQMFQQRVRAAGVTSAFSATDAAAIAPLVDLLDRLPLAIELAAARVRVLPPNILLRRMGERFKLLAARGGRRDRQATLRATLDWSWDLLSQAEQSALAQLSTFEGGFALESAEAVVELFDDVAGLWVADVLQSLVEKSLVLRLNEGRFGMLRTVQEYAAERLAASRADKSEAALRRHWRHFAALAEGQVTADRCIESENVIAACTRATTAEPALAAAALLNCWAVLRLTGPFQAAVNLARPLWQSMALPPREHAIAGRVLASALVLLGQVADAEQHFAAAAELAAAAGDLRLQAQLCCLMASMDVTAGRFDQAEQALRSSVAVDGAAADRETQLMVINGLGTLAFTRSQFDLAQRQFEQALTLAETLGDRRWQGSVHGNLGTIALTQGHTASARRHLEGSLSVAVEVGDRMREGTARCNLGLLLHELGEHAAARGELEQAVLVSRAIGHRRLEATALCNLALALEALHDMPQALRQHQEAVAIATALHDARLEGELRGHLGLALAQAQRGDYARQCFARALTMLDGAQDEHAVALLLCRQARALVLLGDGENARLALSRAESLRVDDDDTELARELAAARSALRR